MADYRTHARNFSHVCYLLATFDWNGNGTDPRHISDSASGGLRLMAKIVFNPPIHIGDLSGGLDINEFRVVTFSFNMQKSYADQSKALLSAGLEHPASGYCYTVTYLDAHGLGYAPLVEFWLRLARTCRCEGFPQCCVTCGR